MNTIARKGITICKWGNPENGGVDKNSGLEPESLTDNETQQTLVRKRKRPWRQSVRHRARKARKEQEGAEAAEESMTPILPEDGGGEVTSAAATPIKTKKKKKVGKKKRLRRKIGMNAATTDGEGASMAVPRPLDASRFRFLNEQLYTQPSSAAAQLFQEDPGAFQAYHKGYKFQLQKWPVNPLEKLILDLSSLPPKSVIADLGCGDAELARRLGQTFKVHSFDLVATNERVVVADMAKLPLKSDSVDVCVYCLSLMGTNLAQFFREAHRVLKLNGKIKIIEIASRFRDVGLFLAATEKMGFRMKRKKAIGDGFFLMFTLEKVSEKIVNKRPQNLRLEACLYKKR